MEEDDRLGLDRQESFWSRFEIEYYWRLLYFAQKRISGFRTRGAPIPSDCTAKDVVHEAVRKVLDGTRPIKPGHCTMLQHLFGAVRSEISNRISAHGNLRVQGLDDNIAAFMAADLSGLTPEQVLEQKQELDRLLGYLGKVDHRLRQLAEYLWFFPVDGDARYAEHLCLTVEELKNLKKALSRAIRAFENQEAHADDKTKAKFDSRGHSGRDRGRRGERSVTHQH